MKFDKNVYFVSDTHFSHAKMLKFLREDGARVRPKFESIQEMDEYMVQKWNETVKPNDIVYHLGDVALNRSSIGIVRRLNGCKRLILGNHDIFGFEFYTPYFDTVHAMRIMREEGVMLTHIPLHINSIKLGCINVHGHIHEKIIAEDSRMVLGDLASQHPGYFNVSVEHHDYTPVSYDIIKEKITKLKEVSHMFDV